MIRGLLVAALLVGCKPHDEPAPPTTETHPAPVQTGDAATEPYVAYSPEPPPDARKQLPPMCEQYIAASLHLGECTGIPVSAREALKVSADRLRRTWLNYDVAQTGNAESFNDACRISYESLVEATKGCPAIVDEANKTVPNAEHPAPSLSENCRKLLSLDATLAACKNIPDADRAQLRETIESLPATLDGVDPVVVDAVDHACSLSLDTLTQLARDCPALVDELHKTVPNVEHAPTKRR